MNKNSKLINRQEKDIFVQGLSHDGRGIALVKQKKTFIQDALPMEKVTIEMTKQYRTYNEAESVHILEPSPLRVSPPCPHFGICGGCNLQHMNDDAQIALKQQTLLEQLKHFGHITPDAIIPPLTASTLGYRRKARLGVKFVIKKDKLLVGFREKKSRYLADLNQCVVLHPKVGNRLSCLQALVRSLDAYQAIAQIEVAIGDEQIALVFRHLEPLSTDDKEKLSKFGEVEKIDIYLQPNPPLPIIKIYPINTISRLSYSLPEEELTYLFHPLDFTQINLELNRLMVKQALDLLRLKHSDTVLDLFCGIGNFTLPIAKRVQQVIGIEGSQEMVERAQENAQYNKINNVTYYAANLAEPLASAPWINQQYDKILLDPPRVGAKELLPYLKRLSAQTICYISCNPATLARDAGELVHQYGYRLQLAGIMNMFPHTAHIEAMAIFEKS